MDEFRSNQHSNEKCYPLPIMTSVEQYMNENSVRSKYLNTALQVLHNAQEYLNGSGMVGQPNSLYYLAKPEKRSLSRKYWIVPPVHGQDVRVLMTKPGDLKRLANEIVRTGSALGSNPTNPSKWY